MKSDRKNRALGCYTLYEMGYFLSSLLNINDNSYKMCEFTKYAIENIFHLRELGTLDFTKNNENINFSLKMNLDILHTLFLHCSTLLTEFHKYPIIKNMVLLHLFPIK